jgi:hypothetical protein
MKLGNADEINNEINYSQFHRPAWVEEFQISGGPKIGKKSEVVCNTVLCANNARDVISPTDLPFIFCS